MNNTTRRSFFKHTIHLGGTVGMLGVAGLGLTACGEEGEVPSSLAANLAHLYDAEFSSYSGVFTTPYSLYSSLLNKQVVSENGDYFPQSVEAAAGNDDYEVYRGFYYSKTELQLYTLAYLLNREKNVEG